MNVILKILILLNSKDIYTLQKNYLDEKSNTMRKMLEHTKSTEPKSNCC